MAMAFAHRLAQFCITYAALKMAGIPLHSLDLTQAR